MLRNHALLFSAVAASVLAGAMATPRARAADTCDAPYRAGIKSVQTPHHVYSTTTMRSGKQRTGEAIFDGKVEYLLFNGKWRRSPAPQQVMVEAAQEKLKTHPDTCALVGDRNFNGQAVTVYRVHSKESGTTQEVRILRASGLLQGQTATLPNGDVLETRYDYANVRAPG